MSIGASPKYLHAVWSSAWKNILIVGSVGHFDGDALRGDDSVVAVLGALAEIRQLKHRPIEVDKKVDELVSSRKAARLLKLLPLDVGPARAGRAGLRTLDPVTQRALGQV